MRQDVIDAGITNKECGFQLDLKGLSLIDLHNSEIHFNGIHHNILSGAFHNLVFEAEKKNRERDSNSPISNIEPKTFHSLEIEASYWRQLSRKLLSSNPEILNSSDKENFYQDMHDDLSLSSIIHQENNIDLNTRKSLFEDKAKALLMRDLDKSKTLLNFERDKYLDLTVILVLYNKAELTYRCLKSLHSLERMPKILVIDNASSDQSQELMSKCKGITYIRNEENVGFLKACNQAREHIDTKYLLLLNNDSVVKYNAIDEALNTFRLQNNLGVVGAKILHLDGLLQEAGSIIWNDGSCIGYGRRKPGYLPQFNFMRDVDFVSGAFFMMPTNLWDKVGGFDEAFYPYYYEEVDLCMRIRSLGYRIVYQPKCVIKHFEYGSSKDFDSALEQMQRNLKVFYDKHKDLLTHHYDPSDENIEIAAHRSIKPNLLFIEDQIPYDELGSGFPRSRRILLELKKYYNVFLLPFVPNNFYKDEIAYEDIMIMRAGRLDDINTIANLIPSIDKVWISRPHNVPNFVKSGLHEIALKNSSKIVYDAEAIFSEREKIRCKIFNERFDSRIEEEEIALLENADIIVSVSDREKELLSKHTTNRIFKVAHPMPSINTDFRNFDNRSDILFIGNLKGTRNESPNVDSIYHFLDKYSKPFIDSGIPIRLIGAIDSEHQKEWESSGAICEGRVDDLQPFFNKALITIAPTRFAAGIPHKVHESLAHGVPVMYTELIGSQVTKDPINEALLKNLSPDFLSKKSNLEILFKKQIQGCSNDMSEDDFKNTIKEICGIK
jgi:GT2 family glycosyltransferase